MEKTYKYKLGNRGELYVLLAVLFFWGVIGVDGWWYRIVYSFFFIICLAAGVAFIYQRVKTLGKRRLILGETAITLPSEWGEIIRIDYSDILEIENCKGIISLTVYTDQEFESETEEEPSHELYFMLERKKMKNRKQFSEVFEEIQVRMKNAKQKN